MRRSLIQAGSKLIDEKGCARLSLREVAKAVGVSHASPYRRFKDKEDLLAAVAQVRFEQLTDEAVKAIQEYACDPKKQLVAASERYILPMKLRMGASDTVQAIVSITIDP